MAKHEYDGFVSKRDDGEVFATALKTRLLHDRKIKAACEVNIDGPDHVEAAKDIIENSRFTLVVIGPNKLNTATDREKSFQQLEIEAALAHYRECVRKEEPYELFFVHLTDTPSAQETDDFNEMLGRLDYGSRHFHHVYDAPTDANRKDPSWNEKLNKVSHAVRYFFDQKQLEPLIEQESSNGFKGADRVILTPEERGYVDHHLPNWLKGHTDHLKLVEGPNVDDTRVRHALFAFEPKRCILLDARRLPGEDEDEARDDSRQDDDADLKFDRIPVLRAIFHDHSSPLMLIGPAGAGKTTSLTTAAALMAGRASGEFLARVGGLMETAMGNVVSELPSHVSYYVPIAFRATSLASALGTYHQDPWKDYHKFLDFLVELLNEGKQQSESDDQARALIDRRLEEQPYAIFIDALDEVLNNSIATRILDLVKFIYNDFAHKGRKIKIVLSSRQTVPGKHDTQNLLLEPLRRDQIHAYIDNFASSLASPTVQQIEYFKVDARNSFDERDSLLEFLSQPFNLNCFCWLAWQDWQKTGLVVRPLSETEFFEMIINHLIKGLNLKDQDEKDLPMGMLRLVLRRMAYDALNSDHGKSKLLASDAEALCKHTLSSAYRYLSSDDKDPIIREDYARELLTSISEGTDLLLQQGDFYEFPKVRFCEYLAGERIDSDALTTASLQTLRQSKLKHVLPSMKYCYGLRIKRNVANYANNVLIGLLSRADQSIAEKNYEHGFDWLNAALECFSSGIDANFAAEGYNVPEAQQIYLNVRKRALEVIAGYGEKIEPARRAETISSLLRLGRRSSAVLTVSEIQQLFGDLIEGGVARRWVRIEVPISDEPDAPTREIQLERTPVLVCEYEDFLTNHTEADDVWGHAENVRDIRIDSQLVPEGSQISPAEIWRKQRRNPGNPVTSVTWYEAVAYAKWMTRKEPDNFDYRLPSEWEMHAISRQLANGNDYPWGEALSKGKEAQANWRGAEIGEVSPSGTFPPLEVVGPKGPVGKLVDFGSNVRIWALDTADNDRPVWNFNRPVPEDERKLVSGASWVDRKEFVHALKRGERFDPSIKDPRIGIRLVREPRENR